MGYQTAKRTQVAIVDGKEMPFKVDRYYATWGGREPKSGERGDPFVEVWADGSITVNAWGGDHWKRVFLYDDEWRCITAAIGEAMRDKEVKRTAEIDKWNAETLDATEFYGTKVDVSRRDVLEALEKCEIEVSESADGTYTVPVIAYKGEKRQLGRTDLKDDVATGLCARKTSSEWREHYLRAAKGCYGARLHDWKDGRLGFYVIDSWSDG